MVNAHTMRVCFARYTSMWNVGVSGRFLAVCLVVGGCFVRVEWRVY